MNNIKNKLWFWWDQLPRVLVVLPSVFFTSGLVFFVIVFFASSMPCSGTERMCASAPPHIAFAGVPTWYTGYSAPYYVYPCLILGEFFAVFLTSAYTVTRLDEYRENATEGVAGALSFAVLFGVGVFAIANRSLHADFVYFDVSTFTPVSYALCSLLMVVPVLEWLRDRYARSFVDQIEGLLVKHRLMRARGGYENQTDDNNDDEELATVREIEKKEDELIIEDEQNSSPQRKNDKFFVIDPLDQPHFPWWWCIVACLVFLLLVTQDPFRTLAFDAQHPWAHHVAVLKALTGGILVGLALFFAPRTKHPNPAHHLVISTVWVFIALIVTLPDMSLRIESGAFWQASATASKLARLHGPIGPLLLSVTWTIVTIARHRLTANELLGSIIAAICVCSLVLVGPSVPLLLCAFIAIKTI